jgi:hypothetical protein
MIAWSGPSALGAEPDQGAPPRIWILPSTHAGEALEEEARGVAIADILTVLISRSTGAEVVEREHLDRILAEHALSRKGLLSAEMRLKVGRLLGATILVSGSFMEREDGLMVIAHATDIASSRLISSHREIGDAADLTGLLNRLQRRLVDDLRAGRPEVWSGRADSSPVESLFFLEGLNHYHAGRYHHALGEFLKASGERRIHGISRLWMAKSYLAQGDGGHAYLELRKLQLQPLSDLEARAIARELELCNARLQDATRELCEELLVAQKKRVER